MNFRTTCAELEAQILLGRHEQDVAAEQKKTTDERLSAVEALLNDERRIAVTLRQERDNKHDQLKSIIEINHRCEDC